MPVVDNVVQPPPKAPLARLRERGRGALFDLRDRLRARNARCADPARRDRYAALLLEVDLQIEQRLGV